MPHVFTRERWKHRNIFETYLLMGPARTLKTLHEETGVSLQSLRTWSVQFKWKDRLAARDQKALEAIEKDNDELYKTAVKERHRDAYQGVQEKALQFIEKKGAHFESDKDAAIALDIGIKGEREVLGLRDSKLKGAIIAEGFAAFVSAVMKPE